MHWTSPAPATARRWYGDADVDERDGGGGTGGRDSGITPIGTGNPFLPDGGLMFPDPEVDNSCSIGTLRCGGACSDPNTSRDHCGGCNMPCADDQFCALGMCVDFARTAGAVPEACVDYETNPGSCCGCGNRCARGICEAGTCAEPVRAIVVIGHDYRTAMRTCGASRTTRCSRRMDRSAQRCSIAVPPRTIDRRAACHQQRRCGDGLRWREIAVSADELTLRSGPPTR